MQMHPSVSFGAHETARILFPGFYFATLLAFFSWAAYPHTLPVPDGGSFLLLYLFVTFVAGLTMYAKETPKRRKAFADNQPSAYLRHKARLFSPTEPLDDDDARRLYFFILNTHMPPSFHDKIFFFGTIYHIMSLLRRMSFWFGLFGLSLTALRLASGSSVADERTLAALTIAVWSMYVLNVRYNKADRKMQENYRDQIFWLEMHDDLVQDLLKRRSTSRKNIPA